MRNDSDSSFQVIGKEEEEEEEENGEIGALLRDDTCSLRFL